MSSKQLISKRSRKSRRNRRMGGEANAVGTYANDAWSLAKRTALGLNEIRKLINVETKFWDYIYTSDIGTSSVVQPITQMAQGLTSMNRVGDSIKLQHVELSVTVQCNTSTNFSSCRVTLLRDLDGYGTPPTSALIYEYTSTALFLTMSPIKFNTNTRFSILFDEVVNVDPTDRVSYVRYSQPHEGHVKYLGTAAAAGSDGKGTIYVVITTTDDTNKSHVTVASRVTFTDD